MIQLPYTLAEIPQDLTGTSGQIYAADVYAIAGSKKRKRSEVALAIDRQGVNIYDVQTSKIITSYAISPQANFTCPPCSIRYRRHGDEVPRRFTYCSVNSPKPQIVCFSERSDAKSSLDEAIKTTSVSLSDKRNPVVRLDTFRVPEEEDSDTPENKVLAVYEDGTVACHSKDLTIQEWSTNVNKGSANGDFATSTHIGYAAVLNVEQARKAILKGREDILATLGTDTGHVGANILVVVIRSETIEGAVEHWNSTLKIFAMKAVKVGTNLLSGSTRHDLQELASQAIPEPLQLQSKQSKFTFNASYGKLYQYSEETLIAYDLIGSIPRLENNQYLPETISSCLQLSPNLLAYATPNSVSIVDLTYYSLQAERKLARVGRLSRISQTPEKQKNQPMKGKSLSLLSYYAPLDIVVALEGRKILAFQLSTTTLQKGGSRKRKRDGLLVNALGRGSSSAKGTPSDQVISHGKIKQLGRHLPSHPTDRDWSAQKAEIDRYSSQSDLANFETVAASALGLEFNRGHNEILESASSTFVNLHKVYYLLSKIFSVDKPEKTMQQEASPETSEKIVMHFLPRRICKWLIERGLFTNYHIERSLKHYGTLPFTAKLSKSALTCALADLDVSLELISFILAGPTPLNARELVQFLANTVKGTERLEVTKSGRLLTNGEVASSSSVGDDRMQLTNGEVSKDSSLSSADVANEESHHLILSLTLRRLYACPSSSVARALKEELSTVQLRLLIDVLRMEIARNGWLSPYDNSLETTESNFPNSNQLCHIAHLLNCAIDSMGTGGWILGTSINGDSSETADTLSYMRAEISAALEGIEEATYLKGILGEMLLCGKNALLSSAKPTKPDQAQLTTPPVKPTTIALNDQDSGLLPLGLKPAPVISMAKVGAGGELIKRSARDIGQLKSKMVGKYSFDRIII
ncbi:hypothetical protein N7G274_000203 [Stereocaulon virgatum]|uniref:Utp8 beta-propeller domain-containing protein n=1 Tax=Stereocaulon virgatum TaxID=373712 RepID=A0ABR4ARG7_9LECA